ncbi:MAG: glycosyltransferase family 4 protein [Actinobacteria bacterium]|nr:glycosyltransferase family 4 protein [Actinomycetota bacterium]
MLVANRFFALSNSRLHLISKLQLEGWEVSAVAAVDESDVHDSRARLESVGVVTHAVRLERGIAPYADLHFLRALARLLNETRPDLVHFFNAKPILFGTVAARTSCRGAKVVSTVTGLGQLGLSRGPFRHVAMLALRAALLANDLTIFQNRSDAKMIARRRGPYRRSRVIESSGIDTSAFQPGFSEREDPLVVAMMARLIWTKGVREFVAAAHELAAKHEGVRFVLAGERDPNHPETVPESFVRNMTHTGAVEYVGLVRDPAEFLRSCDVFVLPSYREGFSRVLLEAMSSGVPVVTTDVPGCRDVIRDGENGIVVPARDENALASAIERLISDASLRQRLGQEARRSVEQRYSAETISEQYMDAYVSAGIPVRTQRG